MATAGARSQGASKSAPTGRRFAETEPDERQRRLGQHERRHEERRLHGEEAPGGGQEVMEQ